MADFPFWYTLVVVVGMFVCLAGGYKFIDYLKIGLPLHAIVGTAVITSIHFWFF